MTYVATVLGARLYADVSEDKATLIYMALDALARGSQGENYPASDGYVAVTYDEEGDA